MKKAEFLTTVYQGIERPYCLEFRAIDCRDKKPTQKPPKRFFSKGLDLLAIEEWAKKHKELDLFFGVSTRKDETSGTKENCQYIPGLWVDVDFKTNGTTKEELNTRIAESPLKPSIRVFSGGCLFR